MSLPTVAVTFTAYDQGGQPVAGARVLAKLDQTEIYQGFVVPEQIEVTTDANGVAVLNLWPNALGVAGSKYRVRAWNPDTGAKFLDTTISVPNTSAPLEQILVREPFPPIDASEQALIAAQEARVQTGLDRIQTGEDRVQTGLDAAATAADRAQTGIDVAAADDARDGAEAALQTMVNVGAVAANLSAINLAADNMDAIIDAPNEAAAAAQSAVNASLSEYQAEQSRLAAESARDIAVDASTDASECAIAALNAQIGAEGQAVIATTKAGVAATQATLATTARSAAEAARDAAQLSAGVYATTATGLAATTNGEYFNVPASSANDSLILYQNSSGTAVEVKRYPSTALVDSLAETTSSNNGTRSLAAWTDSAGEVVMSLSADGKLRVAGNTGPLTDAPQIIENANTVLIGFASADDEVVAGFDSDGDLLVRGHGNLMNRIASNDFITGLEYEFWGDVSKKLFYFDKAKSALGKRININRIVIGWNEDADTDFVRFPYALPLSDTTGLLFFGQRRAPQGAGENGNRLCVRDYVIDYASKTITSSATRVIDQPSGHVNRTGFAGGAGAVKLPNGNIVMTYFRLLPDTMVWSDPSYENHIYRTISTDNGATWSTPTSVMGPAQTYNALTGGTGGMPGSLPSRLGPNSGTGNWLIRIPSGPYAGRLVFSMYFENNYFGCAYSDDGGVTWTRGTLTNASGGNVYNETAIEFCSSDGSIVALRRCENILGVGRFVSTDGGATFSFSGHVSSAGFSNSSISLISSSRSASMGFEKLIAANTADTVNYRRQFHQLRLSYDKGSAFVGKASMFPENMNVGYGSLVRMANGYYLLSYETFNGTGAINTQNNIGVYVFNEAELFYRAALV